MVCQLRGACGDVCCSFRDACLFGVMLPVCLLFVAAFSMCVCCVFDDRCCAFGDFAMLLVRFAALWVICVVCFVMLAVFVVMCAVRLLMFAVLLVMCVVCLVMLFFGRVIAHIARMGQNHGLLVDFHRATSGLPAEFASVGRDPPELR